MNRWHYLFSALTLIHATGSGPQPEYRRVELREQKVRLDKEFGEMLGKIADRKDRLLGMEKKLATLDRTRLGKEVRPMRWIVCVDSDSNYSFLLGRGLSVPFPSPRNPSRVSLNWELLLFLPRAVICGPDRILNISARIFHVYKTTGKSPFVKIC